MQVGTIEHMTEERKWKIIKATAKVKQRPYGLTAMQIGDLAVRLGVSHIEILLRLSQSPKVQKHLFSINWRHL